MKRIYIVVEGQTEEEFVELVLRPHLHLFGIIPTPELLITKENPRHTGGLSNFDQFERDVRRQLEKATPRADMVTMMIDFYGLTGKKDGKKGFARFQAPFSVESYDARVNHLSQHLFEHFADQRFAPYFSTHELEALILSFPEEIAQTIPHAHSPIPVLAPPNINPESIDHDNPPAKRIIDAFPRFSKRIHGPIIAQRIGLQKIRDCCPLFDAWVTTMEKLGTKPEETISSS